MPSTVLIPYRQPSVFQPVVDAGFGSPVQLALVRPSNPPPGVAGFLFDIDEDQMADFSSDITDHFVEDNTAFQDQISLRPVEIEVNGCVGELAYNPANGLSALTPANSQTPAFADNPDLAPSFPPGATAQLATQQAAADSNSAGLGSAQSLAWFFGLSSPAPPLVTRQSNALLYFYNLWKARMLFTVETPWGFWENMAILNITATQPRDTKYRTDFRVRFKQITIAGSLTVSLGDVAGRAQGNAAAAAPAQNGQLGATPASLDDLIANNPFAPPPSQ